MLVFIAHCDDELFYMNSNCRVGILKQHLINKCPPLVPTRAVDLIDTSGSLVYLSWFPNNENAMHLFQPLTTYIIVYLIPIPKIQEAVRIVPTLKNYWKAYPEVRDKISKPMLLHAQTQNTGNAQAPSTPSNSNAATPSAAAAAAASAGASSPENPPAQNGNSAANKLKGEQKKMKKAAAIFGKVKKPD